MNTLDLDGLIPATLTPMNEKFDIDEEAMRNYIRWLLGFEGLKGVAVNMDTGEGPHLKADEKKRILDIWKEEVGEKVLILAGVSGPSTANAVREARDAEEAGADALVVFPIPAFAGSALPPEVPLKYHEAVAESVGIPLVLFQLQPSLGGVIFDQETLARLLDIASVVAIKEASFDTVIFEDTTNVVKNATRKITILTGNDNFILESFLLGADGALIGFGTIAIAEQIEMIRCAKNGDYTRALAIYRRKVRPLANAIFDVPVRDYRARLKEALTLTGILKNSIMRPPLLSLDSTEKRKLQEVLGKVGALEQG